MMKYGLFLCAMLTAILSRSQHTFSIVAVDSVTGEIGSAGATCGDSIIWPTTRGAIIISDILPGVGAIHTQSAYNATNQSRARNRMLLGDSPQAIVSWMVSNDIGSNPAIRQYGVVDFNGGSPRSAAYTGPNCMNYKNHILGPNYAIQGNILLGQEILDSMESRFNRTAGCLGDKLMAAMQGAKVIGTDTRCTSEGTSSLSAFLRIGMPTDDPDTLFMDLNVAATPAGVDPIDALQTKYDNWNSNNSYTCSSGMSTAEPAESQDIVRVYPNPAAGSIRIDFFNQDQYHIRLQDLSGKAVIDLELSAKTHELALDTIENGVYILVVTNRRGLRYEEKVLVR